MNFSAVILAGGQSSRMGRDKAFLEINGSSMLARQLKLVREMGATETFIAGRPEVDYSSFGSVVLKDHFVDAGPLAGIHAAFNAATAPVVLVLAVDMLEIDAAFLQELRRHDSGMIPRVAGEIEPLAAVYPRSGFELADRLLRDGECSVRGFAMTCVESGRAKYLDLPASERWRFKNLNSPADLPCLR